MKDMQNWVKKAQEGVTWSTLELERSNFACRFITRGTNNKNAKLGQKWSERGHVTYCRNFGTPFISRERLELETQILHADSSPNVLTTEMQNWVKRGQKGVTW